MRTYKDSQHFGVLFVRRFPFMVSLCGHVAVDHKMEAAVIETKTFDSFEKVRNKLESFLVAAHISCRFNSVQQSLIVSNIGLLSDNLISFASCVLKINHIYFCHSSLNGSWMSKSRLKATTFNMSLLGSRSLQSLRSSCTSTVIDQVRLADAWTPNKRTVFVC
jgi:hypothetical protein